MENLHLSWLSLGLMVGSGYSLSCWQLKKYRLIIPIIVSVMLLVLLSTQVFPTPIQFLPLAGVIGLVAGGVVGLMILAVCSFFTPKMRFMTTLHLTFAEMGVFCIVGGCSRNGKVVYVFWGLIGLLIVYGCVALGLYIYRRQHTPYHCARCHHIHARACTHLLPCTTCQHEHTKMCLAMLGVPTGKMIPVTQVVPITETYQVEEEVTHYRTEQRTTPQKVPITTIIPVPIRKKRPIAVQKTHQNRTYMEYTDEFYTEYEQKPLMSFVTQNVTQEVRVPFTVREMVTKNRIIGSETRLVTEPEMMRIQCGCHTQSRICPCGGRQERPPNPP